MKKVVFVYDFNRVMIIISDDGAHGCVLEEEHGGTADVIYYECVYVPHWVVKSKNTGYMPNAIPAQDVGPGWPHEAGFCQWNVKVPIGTGGIPPKRDATWISLCQRLSSLASELFLPQPRLLHTELNV